MGGFWLKTEPNVTNGFLFPRNMQLTFSILVNDLAPIPFAARKYFLGVIANLTCNELPCISSSIQTQMELDLAAPVVQGNGLANLIKI